MLHLLQHPTRTLLHSRQTRLSQAAGKFVCFHDVEDAKTFIKCLRRAGYTSSDSVERYVPQEEYVWLNWGSRHGSAGRRVPCRLSRRDRSERGRLPILPLS